jgi:hypothetical protein
VLYHAATQAITAAAAYNAASQPIAAPYRAASTMHAASCSQLQHHAASQPITAPNHAARYPTVLSFSIPVFYYALLLLDVINEIYFCQVPVGEEREGVQLAGVR